MTENEGNTSPSGAKQAAGQTMPGNTQGPAQGTTEDSQRSAPAWENEYPVVQGFDEMVGESGVRENWQVFLKSLNRYNAGELQKIRTDAQRYLRENGVIYRVQEDVTNKNAHGAKTNIWALDPLPLLYTAQEWSVIEKGITQRARLFQALLQDIYGQQKLITEGILPSSVIYAHSGYLRPAVRALAPNAILPLFACDFTRAADGKFWVISDFAQTAPGAGHTLENRLLLARLWPEAFRALNILRIADFFKTLKNTLNHISPRAIESPCIVVLTAGPQANTYFEQAYLASYLGYHLVQSNDLTVQDGQVWLKSLAGLQRVDVIVRYLEDYNCDPLELNPDPTMGVPGLLQAARQQNVAIVNPIGSGVLENPGLYPFLPQICKYLLDEELQLSTVDTWWCGQKAEREHVISHIDSLIIKSIDKQRKTVDGSTLNAEDRRALINEIQQTPYRFVGQARLSFSSAPTLRMEGIAPVPIRQKVFTTASVTERFMILPGGIANTVNNKDVGYKPFERNKKPSPGNHTSKDIWVGAAEEAATDTADSLLDSSARKAAFNKRRIKELESVVPSRAAESMYWAGRYAERCESIARILRCIIKDLNDHYQNQQDSTYLSVLLNSLSVQCNEQLISTLEAEETNPIKRAYTELNNYLCDPNRVGSLANTIGLFTSSAFAARDLWSGDTWRTIDAINETRQQLVKLSTNRFRWLESIDKIISLLMSFFGLTSASMVHEDSWRMLEIGRKIEYILNQSKLLYYFFGKQRAEATESQISEAALIINESLIVQRRQYRHTPDVESVLELLIDEHRNPRGLAYQASALREHIDKLPKSSSRIRDSEAQKLALRCDTEINLINMNALFSAEAGDRADLKRLLETLHELIQRLSDVLTHTYFSHTQLSHQLVEKEFSLIKLV